MTQQSFQILFSVLPLVWYHPWMLAQSLQCIVFIMPLYRLSSSSLHHTPYPYISSSLEAEVDSLPCFMCTCSTILIKAHTPTCMRTIIILSVHLITVMRVTLGFIGQQSLYALWRANNFRKWLLNQKVFIFASSSCPKPLTLGDASSSFPEHSTLGDTKSNTSIRVRAGSALVSSSPLGYILLTII